MSEYKRANSAFLTNSQANAGLKQSLGAPDHNLTSSLQIDGRGPGDGKEAGSEPHSPLRGFSSQAAKALPPVSPLHTAIITTIPEHRRVLEVCRTLSNALSRLLV